MTTPLHEKHFESDEKIKLPMPFVLRRLHSFLGLGLTIFLFNHLLINSQAALFFHDNGNAFISAVDKINSLPYIKLIEILFLGLPFLIHGIWGIHYALTAKLNAHQTDGSKPALPQYKRNHAFSWQRITSWLLLVGILAHVIHMRFIEYPSHVVQGDKASYMVPVTYDKGLPLVAEKLRVQLFDEDQLSEKAQTLKADEERLAEIEKKEGAPADYKPGDPYYDRLDRVKGERAWLRAAGNKKLNKNEVMAVAPSFGGAVFLNVRETFKSPLMVFLYSLFVIAATFHAFNGLWTFMIKWGVTLTRRSQKNMRTFTTILMVAVSLMGLAAAWGTYLTVQWQG